MASTITYRRLDSDFEPHFNSGDGLSDVDAVAQAIRTRLLLFAGEWWADQNDGLPLWQSILGAGKNAHQAALLIQQRIQTTPYVTGLSNVNFAYDSSARTLKFSCTVQTQFGSIVVSNIPTPSSAGVTG